MHPSVSLDESLKELKGIFLGTFDTFSEGMKEYYPIVLVSVSSEETSTEGNGFSYIQGAGDDEESWANVF